MYLYDFNCCPFVYFEILAIINILQEGIMKWMMVGSVLLAVNLVSSQWMIKSNVHFPKQLVCN